MAKTKIPKSAKKEKTVEITFVDENGKQWDDMEPVNIPVSTWEMFNAAADNEGIPVGDYFMNVLLKYAESAIASNDA
jgi:hypothetical protein